MLESHTKEPFIVFELILFSQNPKCLVGRIGFTILIHIYTRTKKNLKNQNPRMEDTELVQHTIRRSIDRYQLFRDAVLL